MSFDKQHVMAKDVCPTTTFDREHIAKALYEELGRFPAKWVAVRVEGPGWEIVQPRTQEAILAACETEPSEAFRRASHSNVTLAQSLTLLKGRAGDAGDTAFAHRCTPTDDLAFELLCNIDAIIAALEASSRQEERLREAVKALLPIGDPKAPDNRVIPIYVRMSELRALHELAAPHVKEQADAE